MKISEHWLREWINPPLTAAQLAEKLTLSGLEVEELISAAANFSKVVVGQVLRVEPHPQADRLKVCLVSLGKGLQLSIVCGASDIREGMIVPVAVEAAELPGNIKITKADIRGVVSHGMLCTAKELGLAEEANKLFELPVDAPLGVEIQDYLKLSDVILNISITPNRGDCLSVRGLAKEVAALTQTLFKSAPVPIHHPKLSDQLPIEIKIPQECARYAGRVIRNVKADAVTPIWMQERLRRSGAQSISPIVDVMNYVMYELGQPMHAFDLQKIEGKIVVRKATVGEELLLLDGNTAILAAETMVIADQSKPLAIAGVMGGLASAISSTTTDIFLESAYFNPIFIGKTVRTYGLASESSYRFERGIDPSLQIEALERATQLLLEITGGTVGPITEKLDQLHLPKDAVISLDKEKVDALLGICLSETEIESIMTSFDFQFKKTKQGWQVTTPARRSDLTLDVDLIEEIIRAYGYDKIPLHVAQAPLEILSLSECEISLKQVRHALVDMGYQEVITYSFIDPKLQQLIDPDQSPKELLNPITADMAVMRTSLWPGLLTTLSYNQNRKQTDIRLFETGLRFIVNDQQLKQESVLSGLIQGNAFSQGWANPKREADYFDLKGDLENLFHLTHATSEFKFKPITTHPALHPGQAAAIYRNEQQIGIIGALHPSLINQLDIHGQVYLFELLLEPLFQAKLPQAKEISKFPEIRRDIAIFVDRTIPSSAIQDTIVEVAGEFLREINIFDVYEGKGVSPNQKSIALALTLQNSSRTLIDEEVVSIMESVITALKNKFAAELRG